MPLTVIHPFSGHAAGARITDAAEIKHILGGPHAQHVVRTADDPAPSPPVPPPADDPAPSPPVPPPAEDPAPPPPVQPQE